MRKKLFLDTNILLDVAMIERPEHSYALMLMDEVQYEDIVGYVSPVSLKDTYYILTKYSTEKEAREFILALLELFEVAPLNIATCKLAANSDEPDFEDGLIRASAESVPVDFIISRDIKAYDKCSIKRLSAKDYISLYCDIEEIDF